MSGDKLDVLAFAAHPDDVEISMGGTVASMVDSGKRVGIIDLTRGELGTRGNAETRDREAADAARILGLSHRSNLALRDGFFEHNEHSITAIVKCIRRFKPDMLFANSVSDRHPDHGRAAKLVEEAAFLSGLPKVETRLGNVVQEAWRPRLVLHYIQDYWIDPDVVLEVSSEHFETKMNAIRAFKSQFFDADSGEPETPISGSEFFDFLKSRAMQFGRPINALYGEGFTCSRFLGIKSVFDLL